MTFNNPATIIGLLLAIVFLASSDVSLKFQKCDFQIYDHTAIRNFTSLAKAINRTTTLVNMRGDIVRELNNIFVHIQLYKKTEVAYRPYMINITESYCDFFLKNRASSYMRLITEIYLPYTNLNHTCPYMGKAVIKDLPLSTSRFSLFWPMGEYRLDVTALEGKSKILKLIFFVEVIEQRPKRS